MSSAIIVCGVIVLVVISSIIQNRRTARYLSGIARRREAESICTFVRAMDYRRLDTVIVRAVYESVQADLRYAYPAFPLRPSDHVTRDLHLDAEDMEYTILELARRFDRNLDDYRHNPHYEETDTVGGIIRFLCAQPVAGAAYCSSSRTR